jgi:hypothetical protein
MSIRAGAFNRGIIRRRLLTKNSESFGNPMFEACGASHIDVCESVMAAIADPHIGSDASRVQPSAG